jgi:hypothetical protein
MPALKSELRNEIDSLSFPPNAAKAGSESDARPHVFQSRRSSERVNFGVPHTTPSRLPEFDSVTTAACPSNPLAIERNAFVLRYRQQED